MLFLPFCTLRVKGQHCHDVLKLVNGANLFKCTKVKQTNIIKRQKWLAILRFHLPCCYSCWCDWTLKQRSAHPVWGDAWCGRDVQHMSAQTFNTRYSSWTECPESTVTESFTFELFPLVSLATTPQYVTVNGILSSNVFQRPQNLLIEAYALNWAESAKWFLISTSDT